MSKDSDNPDEEIDEQCLELEEDFERMSSGSGNQHFTAMDAKRNYTSERNNCENEFVIEDNSIPQVSGLISPSNNRFENDTNVATMKGSSDYVCKICCESGTLICCSKCKNYFHLLCHNPPLNEKRLAEDNWICLPCCCSDSSDEETNDCRPSTSNGITDQCKSNNLREEIVDTSDEGQMIIELFSKLVEDAAGSDYTQYELPNDVSRGEPIIKKVPQPIPSTSRSIDEIEMKETLVNLGSLIHKCYNCGKTSKFAALIQCDMCDLFYHGACLIPPMTTTPLTRFICPNKANHISDGNQESNQPVERVKVLDQYCSASKSQRTAVSNFVFKTSALSVPFDMRKPRPNFGYVNIPTHIRTAYAEVKTRRDQSEWLNAIITMNPTVLDLDDLNAEDLEDVTLRVLADKYLHQVKAEASESNPKPEQCSEVESKKEPESPPSMTPRAIISPALGCSGPSIAIGKNKFHIELGACSRADINLELFTRCRYVSREHATIFYNIMQHYYELISYSEHGTVVDGVLYSHNLEHLVADSAKSTTQAARGVAHEKHKKAKRAPMKRGRKSKAEKAAMAEALAKGQGNRLSQSGSVHNMDSEDEPDAELIQVLPSKMRALSECNRLVDEPTTSHEHKVRPTESIDGRNHNCDIEESLDELAGNSSSNKCTENGPMEENDDVPVAFRCICDRTNAVRPELPIAGYEGTAILSNGSVIRMGCLILVFNILQEV